MSKCTRIYPGWARRSRLIAVGLVWLVTGCVATQPPVQEMSDARQAVAAAREAGADRLAPQVYRRSVALLRNAQRTLERRSFKQARDQALAAHRLAIEAMQDAQTQARRDNP